MSPQGAVGVAGAAMPLVAPEDDAVPAVLHLLCLTLSLALGSKLDAAPTAMGARTSVRRLGSRAAPSSQRRAAQAGLQCAALSNNLRARTHDSGWFRRAWQP